MPTDTVATLLSAALSVTIRVSFAAAPDGSRYEIVRMHAPPTGSVMGSEVAPFEQVTCKS